MTNFPGSIVRCHFYRHWFWPKKNRLNKFGYRKDIEKRISPCERTLWPWFFGLSFGRNFRHFTFRIPPRKAEKREKKRISIQGVSWPNLSTDVSFSGIDFGRKKKIRLSNFGDEKDTEKRISPCESTLWASFFGLSFCRNFRLFTFPIPPRKARKR